MQKKVSVGVFTVCILLAILLSVMTTFVLTRESFVTRARTSDNSAENLAAKLTELDGRFNQHYIGETDYETAEKYVMSAYLAGTGDKYAAYYTAEEYKEMMQRLLRGFRGDRRIRHLQFRIRRDTDRRDFPRFSGACRGT